MKRFIFLTIGLVLLSCTFLMADEQKKDAKADDKSATEGKPAVTKFILVRHGETAWNKDDIYRGTADVPLNEQGREEARLLGEWLKNEKIDAVYCSPLSRARDTAEAIAKHHKNLQVVAMPEIIDINYGEWQGQRKTDVKVKYPDLDRLWLTEPQKMRFPGGGETLDECTVRAKKALDILVKRHPGQTVLLASHRAMNRAILAYVLGWDNSKFYRIGQDTTACNRFNWNGKSWDIMGLNDVCHLRGMVRGAYKDF